MLTEAEDEGMKILVMKLGASGYVAKTSEPPLLLEAIRKVNDGEIRLDSHGLAAVMQAVVESRDATESAERAPESDCLAALSGSQ